MRVVDGRGDASHAGTRQRRGTDFRGRSPEFLVPRGRRESLLPPDGQGIVTAAAVVGGLVAGLLIGLYDLETARTLVAAVLVVVAAFGLALAHPHSWWMSALAVTVGIPVVYFWALAAGEPIPYPPVPNILALLIAVVPAMIGGALGRVASRHVSALRAMLRR